MIQWKPSKEKLYGHPAIELRYDDGTKELTLASKRGEIWAYNTSLAGVICRSPKIAAQLVGELQVTPFCALKSDSELLLRVANHEVPLVIKLLGIPKTRPAQARAANSFSTRFKTGESK